MNTTERAYQKLSGMKIGVAHQPPPYDDSIIVTAGYLTEAAFAKIVARLEAAGFELADRGG